MARKITIIISVIICFVLQTTLFQMIDIAHVSPNILIILTASYGFMYGNKKGMWMGFFCGLLIDIFYGVVLGGYALLYMSVGFLNGYLRKIFFPEDWKLPLASIAISDLVKNLGIYLVMFLLRGRFDFLYYLLNIILPEIVYTLIVAIVIYPVFLKLNKKLEVGEKRRASKFV